MLNMVSPPSFDHPHSTASGLPPWNGNGEYRTQLFREAAEFSFQFFVPFQQLLKKT
jgi:hypothetical protein